MGALISLLPRRLAPRRTRPAATAARAKRQQAKVRDEALALGLLSGYLSVLELLPLRTVSNAYCRAHAYTCSQRA